MLTIDGSQGEGGGQILRTSLALAAITGQAVRIENIRANRAKPGLRQQHLTAVQAIAQVCQAETTGVKLSSRQLTFSPGAVQSGDYRFDIGTAGSTTLVLQTILPPLVLAETPSTVTISGGTHNPMAPPVEFLQQAFLPIVNRLGPTVELHLERPGFYPIGGGKVFAMIQPVRHLAPLTLLERGELRQVVGVALVAGLPKDIGQRELAVVQDRLGWPWEQLEVNHIAQGCGRGNCLTLSLKYEQVAEVVTGFGEKGLPAEKVAGDACAAVESYLAHDAPVGEHLADQLLLPLALAGQGTFISGPLSQHTKTNIDVIERFLPVTFTAEKLDRQRVRISV